MEDRILIIDDEAANVRLLERVLGKAGYKHCRGIEDSRQALSLFLTFKPDLILLDLNMPHVDGFQVMRELALRIPKHEYRPILVLSGNEERDAKRRALSMGAKDFVSKPFDNAEVLQRVQNLLLTRRLTLQLLERSQRLEERVQERTRQLQDAQLDALRVLALAGDARDDLTGRHATRVGQLSEALARALSVPDADAWLIGQAAPLHDVGKLATPDAILQKSIGLTRDEIAIMNTHCTIGASILSAGHSPLLQLAEVIALTHHERWDGTGYPTALAGEDIPLAGRIVAVADAFDAMTHPRPYRMLAYSVEKALDVINGLSGQQFDPAVVEALKSVLSQSPGVAEDGVATDL